MTVCTKFFLPFKIKFSDTYFGLAVHLKNNRSRILKVYVRKMYWYLTVL